MKQQQKQKYLRIASLDGMRGLAALYVVLFHVIADGQEALTADNLYLNIFRFGHEAVVVFIVLSGFVLSLPLARSGQLSLSGGLRGFFKRRSRRILPPYYASLFIFPLFFIVGEFLKGITGEGADWNRIAELYISADMFSHLFLVHTISEAWAGSINPVLWSLATEWWIYFVFALVLIPIWRRFGVYHAAGISIILGLVPAVMLILGLPTIFGSPHLLGAFGLGMVGASLLIKYGYTANFANRGVILRVAGILSFIAFFYIAIFSPSIRLNRETRWITDLLIAIACTAFMLLVVSPEIIKHHSFSIAKVANRVLKSQPLKFLGQFSYSLYLTHLVFWSIIGIMFGLAPIKQLVNFSIAPMPVRILIIIPLLLGIAYVFFLLFERPFLHRRN